MAGECCMALSENQGGPLEHSHKAFRNDPLWVKMGLNEASPGHDCQGVSTDWVCTESNITPYS